MYKLVSTVGLIIALVFVITVSGCLEGYAPKTEEQILADALKKVDKTKLASDIAVIEDSLAKWSLVAQNEPNGVRYIVHELGTGPHPNLRSIVTLDYAGKLLTTKAVFGDDENIRFYVSNFITGWQTTLPLLPEGTRATLYIPSGLAYGPQGAIENGAYVIPPNSNLIFDITLKKVE
jgi:FKBP-type peptidyl-prolyl cis-trans isomerase FkpA